MYLRVVYLCIVIVCLYSVVSIAVSRYYFYKPIEHLTGVSDTTQVDISPKTPKVCPTHAIVVIDTKLSPESRAEILEITAKMKELQSHHG